MPKRAEHRLWGTLASVVLTGVLDRPGDPEEAWGWRALGSSICGFLGSDLPDDLEPARLRGPNHRGPAHSIVAAALAHKIPWREGFQRLHIVIDGHTASLNNPTLTPQIRDQATIDRRWCWVAEGALLGLAVGYGSHLLLDAFTPKGLPLVGLRAK